MAEPPEKTREEFARTVGRKGARKRRARGREGMDVLFGMVMFGVVGWSVAIPTLVGIAAGVWLDATYETDVSWTLMLMALGLAVGSAIAWFWVHTEGRGGRR